MKIQIELSQEDAQLFLVSARKHGISIGELMYRCTMKQMSKEYSFVVADQEDLERKLQDAEADVAAGRTYPANEVFERLLSKWSDEQ